MAETTMPEARILHVRASALPLAVICPGSVHIPEDELRINTNSAPAGTGTAAHAGCRRLVEDGVIDWALLPEIARQHRVDADEVRALCALASSLWRDIRESFPLARTEVELRHETSRLVLTGHTDILSESGTVARLGDWKFGRKDHGYREQLQGYAALALLSRPELTGATSTILWVRDQQFENYTMPARAAQDWLWELEETLAGWDGVFQVGVHCEWCPRSHTCPAGRAMARRATEAFTEEPAAAELASMTPDAVIDLLEKARMVGRYAEAAEKAIRAHVIAHGPVVGTTKQLEPRTEDRRTLKPLDAFPVLQAAGFDDDDMAEIMKLSISTAESIVAHRAPKRKGAAAVRALREKLEAASAIEKTTVTKVVTRRV